MKYSFPAVFESDGNFVAFHFYDNADWQLGGNSMREAVELAEDILNAELTSFEDARKPIPTSTPIESVKLKNDQTVRMIDADTDLYRQNLIKMNDNPLRYAREYAGFSIEELAKFLEAPYQTVSDWDNGINRPPRWIEQILYNYIISAKYSD